SRNEDVRMVHHGIDAKRFRYREEKDDYYLFFSAIATYKGALVAYRIAKEIGVKMIFAGKAGDADGVIIGDSSPNIIHEGQVSNERRAELMSGAKALIFPTGGFGESDWVEALGAVQLEALASGTPVISSDNGACPEIVEEGRTGFICHSYEEMKRVVKEGWADTIDPRVCRMVTVDGRFSSRRMAMEYLNIYDEV
ncbi:MAG: glycosyltransferase, partial [Candidatus Thermoplasmatota archaeon]|nr:glycosyltransferase [Candidatus Thermoplasmatota archaeon]